MYHKNMKIALFPGSFDPPTNGHIDLIKRASSLFDAVDVLIGVNYRKDYMFTAEERLEIMKKIAEQFGNVSVHTYEGLIADYAKKTNANIIVRGTRNTEDFTYEYEMSFFNHYLNNNIETIFLPASHENSIISSSSVKQLTKFGADVSEMVPKIVNDAIREKYLKK